MDASTYLRRRKEAMTQYVRRSPYQDAGMRTETLGKQTATFITNTPVETLACCTTSPAFSGPDASSVTAIKPTNCCVSRDDLYTTPYIVKPCCPFPSETTTYLSPCKVTYYQATPTHQKEAAARMVNRQLGYSTPDCCTSSVSDCGNIVVSITSTSGDFFLYSLTATVSGAGISERGFVFSTTSPPTVSDTKLISGSGEGTYTVTYEWPGEAYEITQYIRAYAICSNGSVFYGAETSVTPVCFVKGTLISLADGSSKPIEEIGYADLLAVWNFDAGHMDSSLPLWIKQVQTSVVYNKLTFSDGTVLKTVYKHRIFNKERGMFTYPMDDEMTPLGTTTVNVRGEEVTLVAKEVVSEEVEYYNIMPKQHMNLFANGILASWRFNNVYPIADMKFVKSERELIPLSAYEGVPQDYYDALRLGEQPKIPVSKSVDWVKKMLALKKAE